MLPRAKSSGILLGTTRIASQSLNSLKIVCVAWVLSPSDLGVFTIASGLIALAHVCSETGMRQAIIQNQGDVDRLLSTVWVSQAVRGVLITAILLLAANPVGSIYDSPLLANIVFAMAIIPTIQGLENIGMVLLEREINFRPLAVIDIVGSVVDLIATVAISLAWGTPYALVAGALLRALFRLVASYALEPRKAAGAASLAVFRELYSYGFWIFLSTTLSFALVRGSDFYLGYKLDLETLGVFQVAYLIACMPIVQFMTVVNRVAFPFLSSARASIDSYTSSLTHLFWFTSVLSGQLLIVYFLLSGEIAFHLFSADYSALESLIPILAIWGVCRALGGINSVALNSFGTPKYSVIFQLAMVAIVCFTIAPLTDAFGVMGAAYALAIAGVIAQLLRYTLITRVIGIRFSSIFCAVFLPLLVSTVAIAASALVSVDETVLPRTLVACIAVVLASFIYLSAIILLDRQLGYGLVTHMTDLSRSARSWFRDSHCDKEQPAESRSTAG